MPMKPPAIDMIRAYLLTASLAAAGIDAIVLMALLVCGCSEDALRTSTFRLVAALAVIAVVLVTKQLARTAFRSALAHRHATVGGAPARVVSISSACPARALVILHLRFNRCRFALAER
jgi:hypothetical protein